MALIASGAPWCLQFPTSTSLADLVPPFRSAALAFVQSLRTAGASVSIAATYRPPERAYLMHWSCMIGGGGQDPAAVPSMHGVSIDWTHGGNIAAARAAAREMMQGYEIKFPAALVSRHTQGLAIDMSIAFQGSISVRDKSGELKNVAAQVDLYSIGASYGVHKLIVDLPHWSSDGH